MSDEFAEPAGVQAPAKGPRNLGWLGILLCSASAASMLAIVGLVSTLVAAPGDQSAVASDSLPALATASGRDPACPR